MFIWSFGIIDQCSSGAGSRSYTGVALVLAKLIGAPYRIAVYNRKPSRLDKIFNPIENFIYKIIGVDTEQTMGWKQYFIAALLANVVMIIIAFLIMVFQGSLPLNPMHFPDIHPDLAFMQAVSSQQTLTFSIITAKPLSLILPNGRPPVASICLSNHRNMRRHRVYPRINPHLKRHG